MSSIGSSELLLLFVIALLVLGPERLPKVARQIGLWVGRTRHVANRLRQQLEREIALSEIAKTEKREKEQRQTSPGAEEAEHERVSAATSAAGKEPPESADKTPSH